MLTVIRARAAVRPTRWARWMSSTPTASSLVTPEWLRESDLQSGAVRVLDCGHPLEYQRAHIPTATSFYGFKATSLKDTRGGTGVMSQSEFEQILDVLGITNDSKLVFYDDELSIGATRAWWVFLHYGFPKENLKVLDGGWKQWVKDVNDVSTAPSSYNGPSGKLSLKPTDKLIGLDDVLSRLLHLSAQFVDARSYAEYTGAQDNGNRHVGHLPGAIHFEWKDGVDLTHNGVFKSYDELEHELVTVRKLPSDRSTPLVTYCQRGIRAAHAAFVLSEVLGYKDVKIYEDSMLEYLNREDTAVERSS